MAKLKSTKSIIQFIILLSIGVLLIWLSLKQVESEKENIIGAFKNANYFWVVISLLISWFSHFLRAYRWNYLLKPTGHGIKIINSNCHVMVGYLANYGIPRMGEISRCTLAAKYDNIPFEVALGTVITERIIDFILFIVIAILTFLLQFNELIGLANHYILSPLASKLNSSYENPVKLLFFLALILIFVIFLFVFRKKIKNGLKGKLGGVFKGMTEGLSSVSKMNKPFEFIFLSILIWVCYFYSLYTCFFALSGTAHLGHKECLTLLIFGTLGVIFSPGGLGAYPAIVGGILLLTYNVDKVSSFALPWLSWASQFVLILVLGLVSLVVLPIYNRNNNVVSSTTEE